MTRRQRGQNWHIFQHRAAHRQMIPRLAIIWSVFNEFTYLLFTRIFLAYLKPNDESSDEEDPLDAFMQGLEQHLEKEKTVTKPEGTAPLPKNKGTRGDIDDEDDEESYYR